MSYKLTHGLKKFILAGKITEECDYGHKDNIFGPLLLRLLENSKEKVRQAFIWVRIQLASLLIDCAMVHIFIGGIFLAINQFKSYNSNSNSISAWILQSFKGYLGQTLIFG